MRYLEFSLKSVETIDETGTGEFEAVLSTSAEDREGESVAPGAFDPLPASIPIYYQHDWQQKALPIGRGIPSYDTDGTLRIKGRFGSDERSQAVRKAVSEGLVDSMSAGYLPLQKQRRNGVTHVSKGDLFEGSMTAIPMNKAAIVTASKSIDDEAALKAGMRNAAADAERLQGIHDLAVANGASCAETKSIAVIPDVTAPADEAVDATVEDAPETTEDQSGVRSTEDATAETTGDPAVEAAAKSVDAPTVIPSAQQALGENTALATFAFG